MRGVSSVAFPKDKILSIKPDEYEHLIKLAKAVGRYYNSEADTTYRRNARRRMLELYEEWCQDFRHED